jgi:hypothetical protein
MPATSSVLGSVDVQGGLWGPDLLAALVTRRDALPSETTNAESYGLPTRASTEQAARAAWTVLTAAWDEFSEMHQQRVDREGGFTYGQDRFTQTRWLVHLLAQLGYDPEPVDASGLLVDHRPADVEQSVDSYPISHLHRDQVPLHLLSAGVPLDTRTRGVIGADRQSPHSLVQDYLNRTSRHLWAIVTNGLRFRILRDNSALSRQSYVEFDLAAVFTEGSYADFALFWHAAHASRFTHKEANRPADCIAERWQEHATETGVAALDDLRDGVEAAIAELGQGFLEHPHNSGLRIALDDPLNPFDASALYRELLYIVYRHVFWFTLDDRSLLHPTDADPVKVGMYRNHYASTRLRATSRAHLGGHHVDGWERFALIATWFSSPDGQPALALPGLLGRLWDPDMTAHIAEARITNRRYFEAVRRLAFVNRNGVLQRINYDAMGSEELGAVYESLLEIRPTADTAARRFQLERAAGSERRKTGSYYTPTSLISVLLDEALDPALDERLSAAREAMPTASNAQAVRDAEEAAILSTTVCDPAMGSAHFLVGAGMRMARRLAQIRTEELEPPPAAVQQAFRDVASRCLYGVDLNPMAVELAKVAIWLECHVPGQPLTFLDHHLKTGNALLGAGFDPALIAWNMTASKQKGQGGVPDAAFKALAYDDAKHAQLLKDRNKRRRGDGGQMTLTSVIRQENLASVAAIASSISQQEDSTPTSLAAKAAAFLTSQDAPDLLRQRLRADAWTASWTMPKCHDVTEPLTSRDGLQPDELPWDVYYDTFLLDELPLHTAGVKWVRAEAERLRFFHWFLEFPEVHAQGGFDVALANPPWEQLQIKMREFFSQVDRLDVAHADSSAVRDRLVEDLLKSKEPQDEQIASSFRRETRDAAAKARFSHESGRFTLGAVGAADTAPLFADHCFSILRAANPPGRLGIILPTKILTDSTYESLSDFFTDGRMSLAVEFINYRKQYFPDAHAGLRFFLIAASSVQDVNQTTRFGFTLRSAEDITGQCFSVDARVRRLCNPITKTPPPFNSRWARDTIVRLYEVGLPMTDFVDRHEVTIGKAIGQSNDSEFFVKDSERASKDGLVPVYESKFIDTLDYREKCYSEIPENRRYVNRAVAKDFRFHANPDCEVVPRNWISEALASERLGGIVGQLPVLLVWANVTASSNSRTVRPALMPRFAPNDSLHVVGARDVGTLVYLAGVMSSFAYDFIVRNKLSGTNFTQTVWRQTLMPSLPPLSGHLVRGVVARAGALSASTQRMAAGLGYSRPIIWDIATRHLWRCEIDAAVFHLFGYEREDVSRALDTFTTVARWDRESEGIDSDSPDWSTKRRILHLFDDLTARGADFESEVPVPELPKLISVDSVIDRGIG